MQVHRHNRHRAALCDDAPLAPLGAGFSLLVTARPRYRWVPVAVAAEALGISRRAVNAKAASDALPSRIVGGRRLVRVRAEDLVLGPATLGVEAVGARLGVSAYVVHRLVRDGELPVQRRGRHFYFREVDVDAFIDAHRIQVGAMAWARQVWDPEGLRWIYGGSRRAEVVSARVVPRAKGGRKGAGTRDRRE